MEQASQKQRKQKAQMSCMSCMSLSRSLGLPRMLYACWWWGCMQLPARHFQRHHHRHRHSFMHKCFELKVIPRNTANKHTHNQLHLLAHEEWLRAAGCSVHKRVICEPLYTARISICYISLALCRQVAVKTKSLSKKITKKRCILQGAFGVFMRCSPFK